MRRIALAMTLATLAAAAEGVPATAATTATAPATAAAMTLQQEASYLIGLNMAEAVKQYKLDPTLVTQAILDASSGGKLLIEKTEAQRVLGAYQQEMQGSQAKEAAQRGGVNKAWLADNAKKDGVKSTPSGLQYQVVSEGPAGGAHPAASDEVTVHYEGKLLDGTVFDASANHGGPATFTLNQVIKGWTEGLQLMKPGDKYRFFIPPELAYGDQAPPSIGPNQILIFEVELIAGGAAKTAPTPETFKP